MNGLLVIDKPLGLSSARVCTILRHRAAGAKVGHAGALDPLATGVLILCFGRATRLAEPLLAGEKRYEARVDLSAFSTTDDLEGDEIPVAVAQPPVRAAIDAAVPRFVGDIMQAPPIHSAIHVNGERSYRLARAGKGADTLPERSVFIHSIDVLDYAWPFARLDVHCGKGVYIRSLARDLGRALGTGGRLAALRRTGVGPYTIGAARTLESLPPILSPDDLIPIPAHPDGADGPPTPAPVCDSHGAEGIQ